MPSNHLKFVIPGAILAVIGGLMLFFGIMFAMIFRLGSGYMYGGYYPSGPTISPMSITIIAIGSILLIVGIVLIAKGVKVYKSGSTSSFKPKPAQPIAYTPSSAPSYSPVISPSYAPVQTPSTVILDTPSSIQDPSPLNEPAPVEKKFCPSCGAPLPEHSQAHFCPTCGGPI